MIDIELASERHDRRPLGPDGSGGGAGSEDDDEHHYQLVAPGDVISRDLGFMRGHGTFKKDDALHASVAGFVHRVNKLISVQPLKTKYAGEIGDVVVGRVTEVQQKRWKVDINSRLDCALLLNYVNLPGGELRRRSAEDELSMRQYLQEGDLVSAEVHQMYSDGTISIHTRSLKYGKLSQGTLVKVSPAFVKRRKTHFHKLPCGVSVILGNNGFIWIYPSQLDEDENGGGYSQNFSQIPRQDREAIARLRSCVLALTDNGILLWDTTLSHAYEASLKYRLPELLRPDVMRDVAQLTRQQMELQG